MYAQRYSWHATPSVFIRIEDLRQASLRFAHDSTTSVAVVRDHQCVAAAVALRVNLTFMGSLERAIANTGLFLPVVQLPVSLSPLKVPLNAPAYGPKIWILAPGRTLEPHLA